MVNTVNTCSQSLFSNLLSLSGLYTRTCKYNYPKLAIFYSFFVFILLLFKISDILLFHYSLDPFDTGRLIYNLFFVVFFVYTRYFYDINKHYITLLDGIKHEDMLTIDVYIRKLTVFLIGVSVLYWSTSTYKQYNSAMYNKHIPYNIYVHVYVPLLQLGRLYLVLHTICYIITITFTFKCHIHKLNEFKNYIKSEEFTKNKVIDKFRSVKNDIKYSVKTVGTLLNLGLICTLFKLPLDVIEIITEQKYSIVVTFISNSIVFLYGVYMASKINDVNDSFITKLYRNPYIYEDSELIKYMDMFFQHNKIYFKVLGTSPTSQTLSKLCLIGFNLIGSLVSGLLSKKHKSD